MIGDDVMAGYATFLSQAAKRRLLELPAPERSHIVACLRAELAIDDRPRATVAMRGLTYSVIPLSSGWVAIGRPLLAEQLLQAGLDETRLGDEGFLLVDLVELPGSPSS